MELNLSDTDIIFIYGTFKKKLAEIERIESSPNCPFSKSTIKDQKAPYISVIEKLKSTYPGLCKMDNYKF